MPPLACIVEGHGELEAVPELIRRIAAAENLQWQGIYAFHTFRVPKDRLQRNGELERTVELAARRVRPTGGIVVIVDADQSCPATLGPSLLARAEAICADLPLSVVLAKWEFESWFLASAASIGGHCGLPPTLAAPKNPEAIQGAKEWLSRQMPDGAIYTETRHQAALTSVFDIVEARTAPSFDKCYRGVASVLAAISP